MKATRRSFFKILFAGVAATIIVPELLVPEEKNKFITYTNPDGIKMTLAYNHILDNPPVHGKR